MSSNVENVSIWWRHDHDHEVADNEELDRSYDLLRTRHLKKNFVILLRFKYASDIKEMGKRNVLLFDNTTYTSLSSRHWEVSMFCTSGKLLWAMAYFKLFYPLCSGLCFCKSTFFSMVFTNNLSILSSRHGFLRLRGFLWLPTNSHPTQPDQDSLKEMSFICAVLFFQNNYSITPGTRIGKWKLKKVSGCGY